MNTRITYGLLALIIIAAGTFLLLNRQGALPQVVTDLLPSNAPLAEETKVTISPEVAKPFSLSEVSNLKEVQKSFGVTFTPEDLKKLDANKFIIKNLQDTSIVKENSLQLGENGREFVGLYEKVTGPDDYKDRTPANAVFISSDVLSHLFSVLSVELLKETENDYLFPAIASSTKTLYTAASEHYAKESDPAKKEAWKKVRNYFAIPYVLLSSSVRPLTTDDMMNAQRDLEALQAERKAQDATADSESNVDAFVDSLALDKESADAVKADIGLIYAASGKGIPAIMQEEFTSIAGDIQFAVPYSIFTVRGSYTSSSLRRQYFRAIQWYQQIPFLLASPKLTDYGVKIGQLLQEHPEVTRTYESSDDLIGVLVGKGDDLDVTDYSKAYGTLGAAASYEQYKEFLKKAKPAPRIKSLPAFYPAVGVVDVASVLDATRGMRFFSQKFIPDSYWTGKLTQGDEKGDVNGQKLPRSASSLEVMTILGSKYAYDSLPLLPYYTEHKGAILDRLKELMDEKETWGDDYWKENQHTAILWSIRGMFVWLEHHLTELPQFMQSPLWQAKTLLTASGLWTELRHTNILYAKQSFAEKGGGGGDECDARQVPPAPFGYVEPQIALYDRLHFAAATLDDAYASRDIELKNREKLEDYMHALDLAREYAKLELENTSFNEKTASATIKGDTGDCTVHFIAKESMVKKRPNDPYPSYVYYPDTEESTEAAAYSRAEELRLAFVRRFTDLLPLPVEGPIVPIKDKRAALIADIHTSDEGIVEEATGVPRVIFVAVKDANGARLTTGFTYSQYEFLSDKRYTDEEWQSKLYTGSDDYQIQYLPKASWPSLPAWYKDLLGTK